MKTNLLIIALFLTTFDVFSDSYERISSELYSIEPSYISEIRDLYKMAPINNSACNQLYELSKNIVDSNNDPLLQGYFFSAMLFKSKHEKNPIKKYSLFKNASEELDKLINKNMDSVEMRFLRYNIQNNAPRFLGYIDNIKEDYEFIFNNINKEREDVREFILSILKKVK